jgi:hypothetical protein
MINSKQFREGNYVETSGNDAWLLAVVVTDPSGLKVQVGGNELSINKISKNFYHR